jgi:hypothetical protein
MGRDSGNTESIPAYPDLGLQQALWIMVASNGVMCCPRGKSHHIPAVPILSEAGLYNTVHVRLPYNMQHKVQAFLECIMHTSSIVRAATTAQHFPASVLGQMIAFMTQSPSESDSHCKWL